MHFLIPLPTLLSNKSIITIALKSSINFIKVGKEKRLWALNKFNRKRYYLCCKTIRYILAFTKRMSGKNWVEGRCCLRPKI